MTRSQWGPLYIQVPPKVAPQSRPTLPAGGPASPAPGQWLPAEHHGAPLCQEPQPVPSAGALLPGQGGARAGRGAGPRPDPESGNRRRGPEATQGPYPLPSPHSPAEMLPQKAVQGAFGRCPASPSETGQPASGTPPSGSGLSSLQIWPENSQRLLRRWTSLSLRQLPARKSP